MQAPDENDAWTLAAPLAAVASFAWHLKQRLFWSGVVSMPGVFEPCGSWQPRQSPWTKGLWVEAAVPVSFMRSAWHDAQSFAPCALSSFARSDACGAWHAVQLP